MTLSVKGQTNLTYGLIFHIIHLLDINEHWAHPIKCHAQEGQNKKLLSLSPQSSLQSAEVETLCKHYNWKIWVMWKKSWLKPFLHLVENMQENT